MKIFKDSLISTCSLANMVLFIIGFSLGIGLWLATPNGLGLTPDSISYLKAAQGLNQGLGFEYFSMQWPPGYSSLIYLIGEITGDDFIRSARLINGVAYFLLFYTLVKLLETCCRMQLVTAAILALLICLHPVVTNIFFYALSEALFLLIAIINITLLINYVSINKPLSVRSRLCLVVMGCLAVSLRYAGLTVVALNILFIVHQGDTRLTKFNKLFDVLIQSLPALVLISLWRLHRGIGDTEANERPLVLHMITSEDIRYGLTKIGSWYVSNGANDFDDTYGMTFYSGIMVCIMFLVLFLWSSKKLIIKPNSLNTLSKPSVEINYIWILSAYICGYVAFLLIIRSLFDPNIVLDNRTLSPIIFPAFIVLITSCCLLKFGKYRYAVILILLIVIFLQALNLKSLVLLSYYNGLELNDKNFKTRTINHFIKSCDKNITIAADKPWNFNLNFLTMVYWLPQYYQYGSGLLNTRYTQQINDLVNKRDLIVVENKNSEIVKNIDTLGAFKRIYTAEDGIVWQNIQIKSHICLNLYKNL